MAERFTAGKPASLGATASALLNTILQGDDGGAHAPSTVHLNPAPRSEWLKFPAMGVPEVDELGFKQAVTALGAVSFDDVEEKVIYACHRTAAVLRRVQKMVRLGVKWDMDDRLDLEVLIELALTSLPGQPLYREMDDYEEAVRKTGDALLLETQALRLMLKATTVAGWKAATPEEIDRAAATAHACAHVLADGRELLEAFASVVESRGMAVEWLDCGETMPRWPKVHASHADWKKSRRKNGKDRHVAHEAILRLDLEHQKRPG